MAYEFLQPFFPNGADGQPTALTLEQLTAALTKAKANIVDLAGGEYVPKIDLDTAQTELTGTKNKLKEANDTIKTYKDMKPEELQQAVTDWESRYNTDTEKLKGELSDLKYGHAVERATSDLKFSSTAAQRAFVADLKKAELKLDDSGKLLGMDDFVSGYKEKDPGAFVPEEQDDGQGGNQQSFPYFGGSSGGDTGGNGGGFSFDLTQVRGFENNKT